MICPRTRVSSKAGTPGMNEVTRAAFLRATAGLKQASDAPQWKLTQQRHNYRSFLSVASPALFQACSKESHRSQLASSCKVIAKYAQICRNDVFSIKPRFQRVLFLHLMMM